MSIHWITRAVVAGSIGALASVALAEQTPAPAPADAAPAVTAEPGEQNQRIAALIEQLGDPEFQKRQEASEELLSIGRPALSALQEATAHDDPSIQTSAEWLVRQIDPPPAPPRTPARDRDREMLRIRPMNMQPGAGNMRSSTTIINGVRTTRVTQGEREVLIHEGPEGVRVELVETVDGERQHTQWAAKDVDELRREHPDAHRLYEQHGGRAAPGRIQMRMQGGQQLELDMDIRIDGLQIQGNQIDMRLNGMEIQEHLQNLENLAEQFRKFAEDGELRQLRLLDVEEHQQLIQEMRRMLVAPQPAD